MTGQLAGDLDDETTSHGRDDAHPAPTPEDPPADEAVMAPNARSGRPTKRQRVSKWDRPPDPHDWRFWVGNVGKVLIATGLLMFGFVAYQLWGTGIETARAQNRLEDEFALLLAEFDTETDDAPATDEGDDPPSPDAAAAADADDAANPSEPDGDPADGESGTDDAAASEFTVGQRTTGVPIAIDLSDEAVVQDPIPRPIRGDPLFRLEIPAIGRDDIVVAGVSLDDLKDGPGHYNDTPLPGQLGNSSVAGHRTTYGAPFFNVDKLQPGDEIVTTLANGDRFVYEVTSWQIVSAADYWVITTRDPDIAELTLTSCHPKYTARDRIVVHSVLNPAKSANVGFPTFYDLEPDDAPIPGDDPVLVAAEIDPNDIEITEPTSALVDPNDADQADDDRTPGGSDTADSGDTDDVASEEATGGAADGETVVADLADDDGDTADPAAAAPAAAAASGGDPTDAFSQGWFDDDGAWVQIALWGMALTVISLLAYQVSKKTRHDSIGFLVGIAPFLFSLYFFFQNIHRLLPPGI